MLRTLSPQQQFFSPSVIRGFTRGYCSSSIARVSAPDAPADTSVLLGSSLIRKVYTYLTNQCHIKSNDTLLLCVSAGVDSMAMLHLLAGVQKTFYNHSRKLHIHVIHFDHKLRKEGPQEAEFVRNWANRYGFPFHARSRDSSRAFGAHGVPNAARHWRRKECLALLNDLENSCTAEDGRSKKVIATAHHSDDQVETVLLKVLRGVHISRLHGMQPISTCGSYIKPLLGCSKQELVDFMGNMPDTEQQQFLSVSQGVDDRDGEERAIPVVGAAAAERAESGEAHTESLHRQVQCQPKWYEDSSNTSRKYKRNQIRLDLVPLLTELSGGNEALRRRIGSLSSQAQELRYWLDGEAKAFLRMEVTYTPTRHACEFSVCPQSSKFYHLPAPVQGEIVRVLTHTLTDGLSLPYDKIQKIVQMAVMVLKHGQNTKSLNLGNDWHVARVGNILRIQQGCARGARAKGL